MEQRKETGAHDREDGHRLCKPVDRRTPVLLHEQENCRDQGSGVTDTDPPDEVDDCKAPGDRVVDTPDSRTLDQEIEDVDYQELQYQERGRKADSPSLRRLEL